MCHSVKKPKCRKISRVGPMCKDCVGWGGRLEVEEQGGTLQLLFGYILFFHSFLLFELLL